MTAEKTVPPNRRIATAARSARARSPLSGAQSERTAIVTVITASLEEEIVLGRRHPRERLIEQDLCDRFKTHRADVRMALFELERKGLIQRIPNRGAMVCDLTPGEVREIYAVREELEVMAVRILPLPVLSSDLDKLDELNGEHSAAVDRGDFLSVFHSNLQFHRALFGLCGNRFLIDTIEHCAQKVYGIRSYANAFPETLNQTRRDHAEMMKALRASSRAELIELTRRHLKPAPEAYIRAYQMRFGDGDRK
jgi:DNA-binding GntR family transcriptional regulator